MGFSFFGFKREVHMIVPQNGGNHLSPSDTFALARYLAGKDWQSVGASAWLTALLTNSSAAGGEGQRAIRSSLPFLIGKEGMIEIFQINPDDPPPAPVKPVQPASTNIEMPALPAALRLTDAQIKESEKAGLWEREFTQWAGRTANQTPLSFHQAGGLVIAGVAIGRRLYIPTHWGEEVSPNLYALICAVSTFYHKSTSLRLAERVLRSGMRYMIMPEPGSPENLVSHLAGDPKAIENMSAGDRAKYERGLLRFAAQRLIVRDELGGLFKSMGKDYMAGMKERLMQFYDGMDETAVSTQTKGIMIIHDVALSIFGTTTPASLAGAISSADWRDGNLARFVLLTPEQDYKDRPAATSTELPLELPGLLTRLHNALPEPPLYNSNGERPDMERWAVVVKPYQQFMAYSDALRDMTAEGAGLDDRLRPLYGRHPVKALKVALILAAIDWAWDGCKGRPQIEDRHWYRALLIAEEWRASAHRCLHQLSTTTHHESESKIRLLLGRYPEGITRSEILRVSDLSVRQVDEVLGVMVEAGEIEIIERKTTGRPAKVYRWSQT